MKIYYHEFNATLGMFRIAFNNNGVIRLDFPNKS